MSDSFPNRLKVARTLKGLTQSDLAEKVGVSRAAVGQWEVGRSEPSVRNRMRLTEVLQTAFHDVEAVDAAKAVVGLRTQNGGLDVPDGQYPYGGIPISCVIAGPRAEFFRNVIETWVETPKALDHLTDIYVALISTDVLRPLYEMNDLLYVTPEVSIKDGDYALIELRLTDERHNGYCRKILVQSENEVVVDAVGNSPRQVLKKSDIQSIHRVTPWRELVAVLPVSLRNVSDFEKLR